MYCILYCLFPSIYYNIFLCHKINFICMIVSICATFHHMDIQMNHFLKKHLFWGIWFFSLLCYCKYCCSECHWQYPIFQIQRNPERASFNNTSKREWERELKDKLRVNKLRTLLEIAVRTLKNSFFKKSNEKISNIVRINLFTI